MERKIRHNLDSDALYEKCRVEILKQLIGLKDSVMQHLSKSLVAVVDCICAVNLEDVPKNSQGFCRQCSGTGVLDDVKRRDWATEQLLPKLAANLRSVDPQPPSNNDQEQLNKKIDGLETSAKETILQQLEKELFKPDVS